MRTLSWATILLIIPIIMACQRSQNNEFSEQEGQDVALIPGADGTLYVGECLSQRGFSNVSDCEFNPEQAGSAARGFHYDTSNTANYSSNWYGSYYNYYVWEPSNYYTPSTSWSTYWNYPTNWYYSLGYDSNSWYYNNNNYDYNSGNNCSNCLWAPNPNRCMRRNSCGYSYSFNY